MKTAFYDPDSSTVDPSMFRGFGSYFWAVTAIVMPGSNVGWSVSPCYPWVNQ